MRERSARKSLQNDYLMGKLSKNDCLEAGHQREPFSFATRRMLLIMLL
jgi:hypothetical protein